MPEYNFSSKLIKKFPLNPFNYVFKGEKNGKNLQFFSIVTRRNCH